MENLKLDFHSIAHDWYVALSPTGFTPSGYGNTINTLAELAAEATRLRYGHEYQSVDAENIGAAVADLNFVQGDAIGQSMKILSTAWINFLPVAPQGQDLERLAILFGDMANGYLKATTKTILGHQETIREAQFSTVRALHQDIQRQRDNLSLTAKRLQTLLDIQSGILSAQSAEAIADVAITQIMRIIPCAMSILVSIDLQQNAFVVLASQNTPETTGDHLPLSLTTEERLLILESRKTLIVNDIKSLKDRPAGLENVFSRGIQSVMTVPLLTTDRLVGILSLGSTEVNFFTDHHDEIGRQIADSVAVALHNRQLLETEQRARRESETLREVAASLNSNLEQEELLENILLQLETLLPYDGAIILLQTEKKPQVVAQRGFRPELIERMNNLDQLPPNIKRLMTTKKPVYIPDTDLDQEWIKMPGTTAIRCWLGAPLIFQGELIGLLALDKHKPDFYQPSAAGLVLTFANQAAVAIENARLFTEVQQSTNILRDRVAARTRDLESLYEIAAITSQPLELPVILKAGLQRILENLACDSGIIHVLDKGFGNASLVESTKLDPSHLDEIRLLDTSNPFLRELIQDQLPILVTNAKFDPRLVDWLLPTDIRCLIGIPMRARGEVQGILSLYCKQEHDFSPDDIKLAASIADHLGVAIDNAKLQAQSEQAAVIEERERLARDLHDSATQSLFSLTLFAAAAREKLRTGQTDIALQHLADIGYTANQTHREMRLLLYQLGRSQLMEEGLVEALNRRLNAVERRSGINVTFNPQYFVNLNPEIEQTIYQIANEALNNALKHAGGSSVTVELLGGILHDITLIIKDNGNGFDLCEANKGAGMGLRNMRLRASKMGGELSIRSSIGEGTEIAARIPRKIVSQQPLN